ncbi:hypothetical protein HIM_05111 [Hirsutella minnesotensis 3608]|uniref:Uncharacterized protein n=1 Tax=Hirsutella minnesotensis 3608 TaxID=1043627 RepID=A0A0F7ZPF6_9HYPO|nr:hypothetical protein HIM_05111 [Hirsutella minnesotensis 3608]
MPGIKIDAQRFQASMFPDPSRLKVRASFKRLLRCSRRRNLLLRLLWLSPRHLQVPVQLSVAELQRTADEMPSLRQPDILQLYHIPLYRLRDTPLRSLYRLYEDLCSKNIIMMSYECDYYFSHDEARWQLCRIPDPLDPDPVRYALLASFAEALVSSFNWRLKLGLRRDGTQVEGGGREEVLLETAPQWASKVPSLSEKLDLRLHDKEDSNPIFLKRNIQASMGYLFCI